MKDGIAPLFAGMMIGTLAGVILGALIDYPRGRSDERAAAVKAGVARWEADPATGATRFVYGAATTPPAPESP